MNCDNIALKIFNYRKKIEFIGPDHYRIAYSLRINYRKMSSMRLPSLLWSIFDVVYQPAFTYKLDRLK